LELTGRAEEVISFAVSLRHRARMTTLLIETIGWLAAALILASYVLLSLGRLEARAYVYQWMNVVGAGGFVLNSGYNGAMPSAGLNVIWAMMGLFTLWSVWRARKAASAVHSPNP
jgi:hypothetical protein